MKFYNNKNIKSLGWRRLVLFVVPLVLVLCVVGIGSVAWAEVVDEKEEVVDVSLEEAQFNGIIDIEYNGTNVRDVPVYKLIKCKYIDVESGDRLLVDRVCVVREDKSDFFKYLEVVDNFDYVDVAIATEEVIFRYKPGTGKVLGNNTDITNNIEDWSIENNILQDSLPLGDFGRLYIPKYGMSFMLNDVSFSLDSSSLFIQWAGVEDLGSTCSYGVERLVYDLASQGFWFLKDLGVGDEIYIKRDVDTVERYRCNWIGQGSIEDGQIMCDGECLSHLNAGGIACFTAMDSVLSKLDIRFFEKV